MALSPQQYLLFWSLHSLSMMDGCTLYEALTTLYSHAQQWLSKAFEGTHPVRRER